MIQPADSLLLAGSVASSNTAQAGQTEDHTAAACSQPRGRCLSVLGSLQHHSTADDHPTQGPAHHMRDCWSHVSHAHSKHPSITQQIWQGPPSQFQEAAWQGHAQALLQEACNHQQLHLLWLVYSQFDKLTALTFEPQD